MLKNINIRQVNGSTPRLASKGTITKGNVIDLDSIRTEVKQLCGTKERNTFQFLDHSKTEGA